MSEQQAATPTLTPVLSDIWDAEKSWTLATYRDHGGYRALAIANEMEPPAIIDLVKGSSLRGRGGAGFPTGLKWASCPRRTVAPATSSSTPTSPSRAPARTSRS